VVKFATTEPTPNSELMNDAEDEGAEEAKVTPRVRKQQIAIVLHFLNSLQLRKRTISSIMGFHRLIRRSFLGSEALTSEGSQDRSPPTRLCSDPAHHPHCLPPRVSLPRVARL